MAQIQGNPVERYSDRAREAVTYANGYAISVGASHLDANHVFAGILIQGDGVAIEVLRQLGVSASDMGDWCGLKCHKKHREEVSEYLPRSSCALDMLDLAIRFCRKNCHDGVGTEHLLVGWLSLNNSASEDFFAKSKLTMEVVERKVLDVLAGRRDRPFASIRRLWRQVSKA